jgi:hypothetical protein
MLARVGAPGKAGWCGRDWTRVYLCFVYSVASINPFCWINVATTLTSEDLNYDVGSG